MLSSILKVGDKIELEKIGPTSFSMDSAQKIILVSQIYDILDDETMSIAMPIVEGRVIPLSVGSRYGACFYASKGLYQTRLIVKERKKQEGLFILIVEVQTELKKFQRRQYFRLSCTMDMQYKILSEEEVSSFQDGQQEIVMDMGFQDGVALDISGGGIRFTSEEKLDNDKMVLVSLEIPLDRQSIYLMMGRVISSNLIPNKENLYEHRVEYQELDRKIRENLIHFIFEEERRQRKKE